MGEDIEWVGHQTDCVPTNPFVGSFFDGLQWFNFVVPNNQDTAIFGSGFDPAEDGYPTTVHFGDACTDYFICNDPIEMADTAHVQILRIQHDDWIFDLGPLASGCTPPGSDPGALRVDHQIYIGENRWTAGNSGDASVLVRNGLVELREFNHLSGLFLGTQAGTTGDLVVSGPDASLSSDALTVVGIDGTGSLLVEQGASVAVTEIRVGQQGGAGGALTVRGGGSSLDVSGLVVGGWTFGDSQASGTCRVEAGASLTCADGALLVGVGNQALGPFSNIMGELVVTGEGSLLHSDQFMATGWAGVGTIRIEDEAALTCDSGILVGDLGDGTLELLSGGSMTCGSLISGFNPVGSKPGSFGQVIIQGEDSEWRASGVQVGEQGTGVLAVSQSGRLQTTGQIYVGLKPGSNGDLTLDSGSQWISTNGFSVGDEGNGTFALRGGSSGDIALTLSGFNHLGRVAGSVGMATVADSASNLTMQGGLEVGGAGNGQLDISDQGGVEVTNGMIVGEAGTGILNVLSGGTLSTGTLGSGFNHIGDGLGSSGAVTVSGPNSRWDVAAGIRVGISGAGALAVSDGGVVECTGGASVGHLADGDGAVLVEGLGSEWRVGGTLDVGLNGVGDLEVRDQGQVVTPFLLVGGNGTVAGDGLIDANLQSSGLIVPVAGSSPLPSTGTMSVTGNWENTSEGTLHFAISGPTAGSDHGVLSVGGAALLGGTLELEFVDGYTPQSGTQFDLLVAGSLFGEFDSIEAGDYVLVLDYGPNGLSVTVNEVAGTSEPASVALPEGLITASPNPFSGSTAIRWYNGWEQHTRVSIVDASGRLVRTLAEGRTIGEQSVSWNGRSEQGGRLGNGVYFLRLESDSGTSTQRIVLVE